MKIKKYTDEELLRKGINKDTPGFIIRLVEDYSNRFRTIYRYISGLQEEIEKLKKEK